MPRNSPAGSFNIADFKSRVSDHLGGKGVHQPNRFRVRIYMPSGLWGTAAARPSSGVNGVTSGDDIATIRTLEFWAMSVGIPPFGLTKMDALRYGYGAPERRPTGPIYTDTTISFICDDLSDNWKVFYNWINLIYNTKADKGVGVDEAAKTGQVNTTGSGLPSDEILHYGPYELSYQIEYLTTVEVHCFNRFGKKTMQVDFREAYPIGIGGMQMNWADNNSFSILPVNFTFTALQMKFGAEMDE